MFCHKVFHRSYVNACRSLFSVKLQVYADGSLSHPVTFSEGTILHVHVGDIKRYQSPEGKAGQNEHAMSVREARYLVILTVRAIIVSSPTRHAPTSELNWPLQKQNLLRWVAHRW